MWELFWDAVLKIGVPLLMTLALVWLFRRMKLPHGFEEGTDDIEGIYLAVVAAIYAVILAFMVFVVWTKYDNASNTVDQEASALMDIQRIAQALPSQYHEQIREDCRQYSQAIVENDWPAMAQKKNDQTARKALDQIWEDVFALQHDTNVDAVTRDHLYTRLLMVNDSRRARLRTARTDLPPILWMLLYFGGALTVFVAAIFTVEKLGLHIFKAIALTCLIFTALFVIQALDHPFRGFARLDSNAFRVPRQHTMHRGR